jgi:hypothetical protein
MLGSGRGAREIEFALNQRDGLQRCGLELPVLPDAFQRVPVLEVQARQALCSGRCGAIDGPACSA